MTDPPAWYHPDAPRSIFRWTEFFNKWLFPILLILVFALGLLIERWGGPDNRVHLLALPLWVILVWNMLICVALGIQGLLRPKVVSTRLWEDAWQLTKAKLAKSWEGVVTPKFRQSFASEVNHNFRKLNRVTWGVRIQLLAISFILGILAGLYLRGVVWEYQVGWESTFFEAHQVHAFLNSALAPAAGLLGVELPSVEDIAALRWGHGEASSPAAAGPTPAQWVHLFALTLTLFALFPRVALALVAQTQRSTVERSFKQWLTALHSGWSLKSGQPVHLISPGEPDAQPSEARVRHYLQQHRWQGDFKLVSLPWESEDWANMPGKGAQLVIYFSAVATPEDEVHGEFVHAIIKELEPQVLLVLVDATPLVQAWKSLPERLKGRQQLWREFILTTVPEAQFSWLDDRV
ncbi:MAG: DUF2868 domain-containing protein [Verrucomicrobiales bacterium]